MLIPILLRYLSLGAGCQLEEQGYCNFSRSVCRFGDQTNYQPDASVPLNLLVNQPINNKDKNHGCQAPKPGDPEFKILIEPCYTADDQQADDTQERCPDVPIDYFRESANEVLTSDSKRSDSIGFVSGVPVEFQITHIGRQYLFDTKNTEQPSFNEGKNATMLSDFPFRVLPINDGGYQTLVLETAKKVKEYYRQKRGGGGSTPPWFQSPSQDGYADSETIVPWPELTCPMEVVITDNRSPSMSLKVGVRAFLFCAIRVLTVQ